MNRIEQNTPKRFFGAGLFATRAATFRGRGSAVCWVVSCVCRCGLSACLSVALLATPLVLALSLTVGVSPAAAATGPPILHLDGEDASASGSGVNLAVFSTRMSATGYVSINELTTEWRAEYSTSKSALDSGAGILASSGIKRVGGEGAENENINIEFGTPEHSVFGSTGRSIVRHLTPNTHYYARFVAKNADGTAEAPFEFTTHPVAEPEVPTLGDEPFSEVIAKVRIDVLAFYYLSGEQSRSRSALFRARVESNGAASTYSFGLSRSPSGPFSVCGSGSISVAEEVADREFDCTGLEPETTYYDRLLAINEAGTLDQTTFPKKYVAGGTEGVVDSFTTATAKPVADPPQFRNVTAESAHVEAGVIPHGEETRWRFETAPSAVGPWTAAPGASGTISLAEAEAQPEQQALTVSGVLTGLSPAKTYFVRLFSTNASGEEEYCHDERGIEECEPASLSDERVRSIETTGPPAALTLAVHSWQGESLRVIGAVDPENVPTSAEQTVTIAGGPTGGTFTLTFEGHTTEPIAFDAPAHGTGGVEGALHALPGEPSINVQGADGGPYTIDFTGSGDSEVEEPAVEADASGLTPSGAVTVSIVNAGGVGYDTHARFQYLAQKAFEREGGFTGPEVRETPEVDVGTGTVTQYVGAVLSGLVAGESYRYRLVARSTFPGPAVIGGEQQLAVPAISSAVAGACPNEALRSGASAALPDCRGYEQLTPVHKEGAREPFNYGLSSGGGVEVAEGGGRVMVESEATDWGTAPGTGQSPYFFSREEAGGWRMTEGSPQPATGIDNTNSEIFSSDLANFAFSSAFKTSEGSESVNVEYKAGPAGGPYTTVAVVPRGEAGSGSGWVAASQDFSKLFLAVEDHTLLGASTGTVQGDDLYEYAGGELRQVNVLGSSTIGACGAKIVDGYEERGLESSAHSVSSDGSRVFFEAIPSKDCTKPANLYMRENGESTVDLGTYTFLAANSSGSEVLLEKRNGSAHEILLEEVETATLKPLFTLHEGFTFGDFGISENLETIYFLSRERLSAGAPPTLPHGGPLVAEDLYRYDISSGTLSFIDAGSRIAFHASRISPDGQDLYIEAESLEGVPGGEPESKSGVADEAQVYRYDGEEDVLQCMSCASPTDPEPKLPSTFGEIGGKGGIHQPLTGYPKQEVASANGDYVFFDTASALVSADVDGEVTPENPLLFLQPENGSSIFSVSSDVYEWRKAGVSGCAHLQGCLALITNGRGGFLNLFLGTDESGRDAFIYTSSRLVPQDEDTAGDVYDARIGGGTPPIPPRPVECEGDACSTPAAAPDDATPASLTFTGNGNILAPLPAKKPTKPAKKRFHKARRKHGGKARRKRGGKAPKGGKASRRSVRGAGDKSFGRIK